jgi:branched-chain amino acid transport system ATP-binding protein
MKLSVQNVWAGYGGSQVLQGMSFEVNSGEIVTIFGRNGSGRSTALKAIAGVITPERGSIRLDSRELVGLRPDSIARSGVAYVPEDRQVFAGLTVEENLRLGESRKKGFWTIERVWELFPRLMERRSVNAGVLSGGEQQMLTICRALVGNPGAILIDEPTEGLAPKVVGQVMDLISIIRNEGTAVVLVEQKTSFALSISDRAYVVGHGHMVFGGAPTELQHNEQIRRSWLEV